MGGCKRHLASHLGNRPGNGSRGGSEGRSRGLSGRDVQVDFGGEEGGVLPVEPEDGLRHDARCESQRDLRGERQGGWDGDSRGDCRSGLRRDFRRDFRGNWRDDSHGAWDTWKRGRSRRAPNGDGPTERLRRTCPGHRRNEQRGTAPFGRDSPRSPERKAAAFAAAIQGSVPG